MRGRLSTSSTGLTPRWIISAISGRLPPFHLRTADLHLKIAYQQHHIHRVTTFDPDTYMRLAKFPHDIIITSAGWQDDYFLLCFCLLIAMMGQYTGENRVENRSLASLTYGIINSFIKEPMRRFYR
jgi:hypothetical protein